MNHRRSTLHVAKAKWSQNISWNSNGFSLVLSLRIRVGCAFFFKFINFYKIFWGFVFFGHCELHDWTFMLYELFLLFSNLIWSTGKFWRSHRISFFHHPRYSVSVPFKLPSSSPCLCLAGFVAKAGKVDPILSTPKPCPPLLDSTLRPTTGAPAAVVLGKHL